jgi:hypothetical protein
VKPSTLAHPVPHAPRPSRQEKHPADESWVSLLTRTVEQRRKALDAVGGVPDRPNRH